MNKLKIMLIAMLGMVMWACSNDDMPSDSELDKLDQVENPNIVGLNRVHRLLDDIYSDGTRGYTTEPLERSILEGDYSISIIHSASEFEAAGIEGSSLPLVSFNSDFSQNAMEKFRLELYSGGGVQHINLIDRFPDIDWSSQSLVYITRKYSTTGMDLNKLTGKIYRNGGGFVITLQNEIIFDMTLGQAFTYCGFAVIVDKANIQPKDLKIRLDNTEYNWLSKEKKSYSKWLKL